MGGGSGGNHLMIYSDGKFGCVATGEDSEHRREIFRLARRDGTRPTTRPPKKIAIKVVNQNWRPADHPSALPTNRLLELDAMIAVLTVIEDLPGTVAIHVTAENTVGYLNNGQAKTWRERDWRKSGGDPVKNADSWAELLRRCEERHAIVAFIARGTTPEMKQCEFLAKQTFKTRRPISRTA